MRVIAIDASGHERPSKWVAMRPGGSFMLGLVDGAGAALVLEASSGEVTMPLGDTAQSYRIESDAGVRQ